MNLIFLGAPGAGKGTQSEIICSKLNIITISTGNIIREAIKAQTPLGKQVKSFLEIGKLVTDDIVINLVKDRIAQKDCENGFILDGFPRTVFQADALSDMIKIDKVININVSQDIIFERLKSRLVCSSCSTSYNVKSRPPKMEGICDKCSSKLIFREDDREEIVKKRLEVYYNETQPLVDYYKNKNLLLDVDGTKPLEESTDYILSSIGKL